MTNQKQKDNGKSFENQRHKKKQISSHQKNTIINMVENDVMGDNPTRKMQTKPRENIIDISVNEHNEPYVRTVRGNNVNNCQISRQSDYPTREQISIQQREQTDYLS